MVNQGTSQETLVLPSFTGPKTPTFTAPGGLSVQIAEGDFKSQINTLGAQPGMGYLNDLAARKDVNWQSGWPPESELQTLETVFENE